MTGGQENTSTNLSTSSRDFDVESGVTRSDTAPQSSTNSVRDLISEYASNAKQTVLQTCKEMWDNADHPLRATLLSALAEDNATVHSVATWAYACDLVVQLLKESEE
ncbi:hypothetical protein EHS25_006335 [Saitozyma podzolica]|uniref:Uncharacterized protein n=1 Tax=Saitozyma podzolica TaxID=1890683 RepID=A0A427YRE2_9TREE|nr:hypothetical protein EHS25_006335 [Saitozyma podzolica]